MLRSTPVARAEVFFSGHVQGVGFRYAVHQVAKGYEVAGMVENLADGRVRMVAEADRAELDAFVTEVAERMHGSIRKTERHDSSGPRTHAGFVIR